mmetsp:Transcript_37722/g.49633  ORF Transcript_37722/g.49633 Transcript_37722/m.49633 type:complete len:318 (-) Transcript_37722:605-1558(-)
MKSVVSVVHELAPEMIKGAPIGVLRVAERVEFFLAKTVQVVAELLQFRLPLLEEQLTVLGHRLSVVETVSICPLQDLTALNDRLDTFLEELKLSGRVTHLFMQEFDLKMDVWHRLDGDIARPLVICVSLEVPLVARHLARCPAPSVFCCSELGIFFLLLVEIALVVAAGSTAVLSPVTHAYPTKVVPASTYFLPARHVVAALILLYVLIACRALLRVGHEPRHIFRLSVVLGEPLARNVAVAWRVRAQSASEASHSMTNIAFDIIQHHGSVGALASDPTLGIGAPLNVFVLVSKRLTQPFPIQRFLLRASLQKLDED